MPELTLGLDIGNTSIGWALVDEAGASIVDAGVRIFPEGVDRPKGEAEQSKCLERRVARGMRRQVARRAARKFALRVALWKAGLAPEAAIHFGTVGPVGRRAARMVARAELPPSALTDPRSTERLAFDRAAFGRDGSNPYELRRRALTERLEPHEIGRLLVHLNQRRGFKSNRRSETDDEKLEGIKKEMSDLAAAISAAGHSTLGEHMAAKLDTFSHTSSTEKDKARKWHTLRDMYEKEFEAVWASQRTFHPELLTDTRKAEVFKIIFFQRDLYWPRSIVGRCELEPRQRRCERADRAAQRFRILQEVNNLAFLDKATGEIRPLSEAERARLIGELLKRDRIKFERIRKFLKFPESAHFNLEQGDRKELKGMETDHKLAGEKFFGDSWWTKSEQERDNIVRSLVSTHWMEREQLARSCWQLGGEDVRRFAAEDEEVLRAVAVRHWGLEPTAAAKVVGANLPEGYASLSRTAILKLIPELEKGLPLNAEPGKPCALVNAGYLLPHQRVPNQRDLLPAPPELTNPIVRAAMFEVRKVVNAVVREYGKPATIRVELARDAKKTGEARARISKDNRDREAERRAAADEIEKAGSKPTRNTIEKYRLWLEQERFCMYSGLPISLEQLLGGEADVDHIIPYSRCLDDSYLNKVLCFRDENHAKGQRTVHEWLAATDPEKYDRVLRDAENRLPFAKRKKVVQKDAVVGDFIARQLTDTAYIATKTVEYLRCLGADVKCVRGDLTAELRHRWGLNTVLNPPGETRKNRADHRHHAVDAVVIALTDARRLQWLTKGRGADIPKPWDAFHERAADQILKINVSHRARRKISGTLHEDTIYGCTEKGACEPASSKQPPGGAVRKHAVGWIEAGDAFVRRKAVASLNTTAQLEKVRDPTIKEVLRQHVRAAGVDPDQKRAIPPSVWKVEPRMQSGMPIRKVRMIEESDTFRMVRPGQYVKPGNNHHISYFEHGAGANARLVAEVTTMWDAARAAREHKPVAAQEDASDRRFLISLSINESFVLEGDNGESALCIVRKMDQRARRLFYKSHTDARPAGEIDKDNLYLSAPAMKERKGRKVAVDPLGRIHPAHD